MNKVTIIRNEDTKDVFGVYDIENLQGGLKGYYEEEFESYDDYEQDLIDRGAVEVPYDLIEV